MLTGLTIYPKRRLSKMADRGDYREALEYGDSIEKRFARDPDFLFIMGGIYYVLGNADNAIHYFDRVLEIREDDTEALLLKASVHLAIDEKKDAEACCREILHLDPRNDGAQEILDKLGP